MGKNITDGQLKTMISSARGEVKADLVLKNAKILNVFTGDIEEGIDPFMTLAFTALPVIPKMRILTNGMVDAGTQSYVPVFFD